MRDDNSAPPSPTTDAAVVAEIGWIAREARALADSRPPWGSPDLPAWRVRQERHETRRRVLLAKIDNVTVHHTADRVSS